MADPSTSVTPTPSPAASLAPVSPSALRIVLFGLPAAGKSSLLGALSQAGQTQEHLLSGRLIDHSGGHLAELQHRLYEERSRPTADEVAPYAIELDPFAQDGAAAPKVEAVLIDCDGRVANDLLARRRALHEDTPEGTLAQEVVEADTLVLVVDAAAPPVQVDAEFTEFGRFLRLLEQGRGRRSEVGGLPVFLVLTKCDLLAQPKDTAVDWMERIEERKRQVHGRFQDFLARQAREEGPLPFGRIDLHLWATAVKRPALGPSPAKPREPYAVAELFRQCLEMAQQYRQRRRHSSRRLLWTVGGAAGLLTAMSGLTLGLYFGNQARQPNPLSNKVEQISTLAHELTSVRLREPLQPRIAELTDLENDPKFATLPEEQQDVVRDLLAEMKAYETFREQVQQVRPLTSAGTDAELKEIEEALARLHVPEPYRLEPDGAGNDWSQTEAAQRLEQRKKDLKAFRAAVDKVEDWYRDRKAEADRLLRYRIDEIPGGSAAGWSAWYDQLKKLVEATANPPFRADDPLPGSTTLTYAAVARFNRVAGTRTKLDAARQHLDRVRDMAAALGLVGPLADRPALLVIPKPPDFSAQDARGRLLDLQKSYAHYKDDFLTAELPDAIGNPLRTAARLNYDKLLDPGRAEVLRRLQAVSPDAKETIEHWRDVRAWLKGPPEELASWLALARVLGRLNDAAWEDPVNALAVFLSRDSFDLDLRDLVLEIPYELDLKPAGKLEVFHPPTNSQGPALVFDVGSAQTDDQRRVRIYRLRADGSKMVLTYHPGDKLWATLAVDRMGSPNWQFTWTRGRSEVYQFDHLARAPLLQQKDQDPAKGDAAPGVVLRVPPPGTGVPSVPELMPVVRLEKR